jgi:hypothetical protein
VSLYGAIRVSDASDITVQACAFHDAIGLDRSAIIYAIQNEAGHISLQDTTIVNTLGRVGTISLNTAQISIDNCTFRGCYSPYITNGISMIGSQAVLNNSLIDN